MNHLDELEAEAIYIMREVAAECEKPVMLYSIGKDSSVMLHLALKAFWPEKPPFPFLHVNTTWKFHEMIEFRDRTAKELGLNMLEYINEDGVREGVNPFTYGASYTDIMKTQALKAALNKYGFTAAFGGGRRDEEKSRAKERVFRENIPIVSLYFAKERPVVERDGQLIMVDDDRMQLLPGEKVEMKKVRFRTLGCYPLTGGMESDAETLDEIVDETLQAVESERTSRIIDKDSGAGSMEKRKREGYF